MIFELFVFVQWSFQLYILIVQWFISVVIHEGRWDRWGEGGHQNIVHDYRWSGRNSHICKYQHSGCLFTVDSCDTWCFTVLISFHDRETSQLAHRYMACWLPESSFYLKSIQYIWNHVFIINTDQMQSFKSKNTRLTIWLILFVLL